MTEPEQAGSTSCAAAATRWPATVAGQQPTKTSSVSASVRAWGDPAIIARCGVTSPGPTSEDCIAVSGVDWVVTRLSDGARFTTYGRTPAIEVLVPDAYAPEPLLLPAFAAAATALPQGAQRCL